MQMRDWLLGAATLLVGQLLGLLTEVWRRRLMEKSQTTQRITERGDDAAKRLLEVLDDARDLFRRDAPDPFENGTVYALCHRIDREAVMVPNAEVRATMEGISGALWYSSHLFQQYLGASQPEVAFVCASEGRAVLGAFLRGETVVVPDKISQYRSVVDHFHAELEGS